VPDNLSPTDKDNPYADYTPVLMYAFLRRSAPPHAPDEQYAYSNLGAGLLGHALSLKAGTSFEQLLTDRITKPLGMGDTSVALREDQLKRLAPPHDPEGRPAHNWDFPDVIAGAGGIRSTPNDMARYVAANLGIVDTPLKSAMARSHQSLAKVEGNTEIGMNWHIATRRHIVWHNGQTGAYHTYVGFIPEKKIGVVLLDNYSESMIDTLGPKLLAVLAGEKVEPLKLPREVALDPARLDEFVGDYAVTPLFYIRVARDGDHLTAQATLQPALRIYAQSDSTFFYKSVQATLTFERDAAGKVTSLALEQDGTKRKGPRIK
jgi:CubicO group peptidase (beta-lactamase class C family)